MQSWSQQNTASNEIIKNFQDYTASYQGVVYAHLNKSKLVQNEMLGFTAYVFDQHEKTLSVNTKNLYCIVSDENKNTIAKQLIEVTDGVAIGSFKIDSTFQKGNYTLNAYTNWMLNFNDSNHFVTNFEVIDGSDGTVFNKIERSRNIDLQILPESGHFLEGTINTAGIIAKDSLGYGASGISGKIVSEDGKMLTNFKLNELGIGRFTFIPSKDEKYQIITDDNGKTSTRDFKPEVHAKGVILKINHTKSTCIVSVVTNESSLKDLKEEVFILSFHDGNQIKTINVDFNESTVFTKKISLKNLSKGINIFTLFDAKQNPIAERLFFNYHNLNIHKSKVKSMVRKDTLIDYALSFKDIVQDSLNNVSISILPSATKAYKKNSSIIAQSLIQPYINGHIENGNYYFTKINAKKRFDLDNLLLTQGWSSFRWDDIFGGTKPKKYAFEKGITLKVDLLEKNKNNRFLLHSNASYPRFIDLNPSEKSFIISDYYPTNDEFVKFSRRSYDGKLSKAKLKIDYFPDSLPEVFSTQFALKPKPNYFATEKFFDTELFKKLNDVEELEGIVIDAELLRKKSLGITNTSFGRILKLDDLDRNQTLANYVNSQVGYTAFDNAANSQIFIKHRSGDTPAIVLNDVVVTEERMFYYWLDMVDYIVIDPLALEANYKADGGKVKIYRGAVKVYENPKRFAGKKWPTLSKYKLPVHFTGYKSFYRPKYISYRDDFFKEYGVIDWLPKNRIDKEGNLEFQFWNDQNNNITLYLEGVTQNGDYILEEKTIVLKP